MIRAAFLFTILFLLIGAIPLSAQHDWERLNGIHNSSGVQALLADANTNRLYAGTLNGGGFFVSGDDGVTWTYQMDGFPGGSVDYPPASIYDLALLADGSVIAACDFIYKYNPVTQEWGLTASSPSIVRALHVTSNNLLLAGGSLGGFFRSTDGGNSWAWLVSGLPANSDGFVRRITSITSSDSNVWYLTINEGDPATEAGLYKTENGGGSWQRVGNGLMEHVNVNYITRRDDGMLFIGINNRIYISGDDAATWAQADSIPMQPARTVQKITFNPAGEIFALTQTGSYRANPDGTGWVDLESPIFPGNSHLLTPSGTYLVGGPHQTNVGIFRLDTGDNTWSESGAGLSNAASNAFIVTPSGTIMNGSTAGRVDVSHDGGNTFTTITLDVQGSASLDRIRSIAANQTGTVLAVTGEGTHRSNDEGATWERVSDTGFFIRSTSDLNGDFWGGSHTGFYFSGDLGATWTQKLVDKNIQSVLVTQDGTILAGTFHGELHRSTDGGDSWTDAGGNPFANTQILALTQRTNGDILAAQAANIFRSTDDGQTWTTIAGFGSQVLSLFSAGNTVYAGVEEGLYQQVVNAPGWNDISEGKFNKTVSNMGLLNDGRLVVATNAGLYRTADAVDTNIGHPGLELPIAVQLHQNYPNPFNPATTIAYALPHTAEVRLDVFNMMGQRVATLVDHQQIAGWHSIVFDASRLSSGVYVYRLQVGNMVQTRKMVLVK